MASISIDEWVLFISFMLIYGIFLFYDLFKRGEKYGFVAYIVALLPANYLWYLMTKNENFAFGAMGAMMILCLFWILAVVRDIFLKDKKQGFKDADDVALILIIGIIVQLILSAVLPAIPGNEFMQIGTMVAAKYFYLPQFDYEAANAAAVNIILAYKILSTVLTISIMIPIVLDLRDAQINIVVLLIITLIFLAPFAFLAFLWMPQALGVMMVLISVIFFIILLMLTKGMPTKK